MQYGFILSNGDLEAIGDLAQEAEAAGWDGVFYYDAMHMPDPMPIYDPWIVLALIALRTRRVRLGAILTPPSRRRPWKLARETVTLDHLSGGRLVLPVGLGAIDTFGPLGEVTERRLRAQRLDESLDILQGLWSGKPFSYQGAHYQIEEATFLPAPLQSPRIPIWVVGLWPRERSMRRVLRYDGLLPNKVNPDGEQGEITPADIAAMRAYITERRSAPGPFDIIMEGRTPGEDPEGAAATVRPFAEAGATWWVEALWTEPNAVSDLRTRIRQGPPRVE